MYIFDVGLWILTYEQTQWDNQMQQQGINPHLQADSQIWFTNEHWNQAIALPFQWIYDYGRKFRSDLKGR